MCGLHAISLIMVIAFLWGSRAVTMGAVAQAVMPPSACAVLAALAASLVAGGPLVLQGAVFGLVYMVSLRALFAAPFAELVGYLPQSGRLTRWLGFARVAPV